MNDTVAVEFMILAIMGFIGNYRTNDLRDEHAEYPTLRAMTCSPQANEKCYKTTRITKICQQYTIIGK